MKCWHCGNDMIWGGDFSFEDYGEEGEGIISNFSCSVCPASAEVRLPFEDEPVYKLNKGVKMSAKKKNVANKVVSAEVKLALKVVEKCQKALDAASVKLDTYKKLVADKKLELLKAKDALKTIKG